MNRGAQYAQALYRAQKRSPEKSDVHVRALYEILVRERRVRMLPSILRAFRRLQEKNIRTQPRMTVARTSDISSYQKNIEAHGFKDATVTVEPSVIGGWRGVRDGILMDATHKQALLTLYKNIIQ